MPAAAAPRPADCRVRRSRADKLDTRPDLRVAELAADAWGVLSLDELRACGLTRDGSHGARAERPAPPPSPRCLRRGAPQRPTQRPLPRRDQGLRPNRSAQPLLRRRPLRTRQLGRPLPRGHGPRDDHEDPPRHPCPPLLNARCSRHHAPLRHPDNHPGPDPHRPRRFLPVPSAPPHRPPGTEPPHQRPADPERARPPRSPPGHRQPHEDPGHRPRADPQRARGHRPRPDPRRRLPAPRRQPTTHDQRPPRHPRLPLADPAPRHRGRRRRMARQPPRARGRRRAPGAARGLRRARHPRHVAQAITRRAETLERIRAAGAPA